MPKTLIDLFGKSSASQASYGEFAPLTDQLAVLIDPGKGDFSRDEAQRFLGATNSAEGYELLHHLPDVPTGFSATIFRDKNSGRITLAIRGTKGLTDIAEDINRIGIQGYAGDQFVSLYRYYKSLTTAAGQKVIYTDYDIGLLQAIRSRTPAKPEALSSIGQRSRLRAELEKDVGATPLIAVSGTSVIAPGQSIDVTGHSLGGHLALLFGRFFPDVTSHVYTYNAPGISIVGELALAKMGIGQISPSAVTNVNGAGDLISKVWSKAGQQVSIFTEAGSPIYHHSIVPLTDALSLYSAFATLSPSLANSAPLVSAILGAATFETEKSLEVVLDHIRGLLGSGDLSVPTSIATTLADLDARNTYYRRLFDALESREPGHDHRIQSLVGRSAAELSVRGASEVAVRYALRELMPFAAHGADYTDFDGSVSRAWVSSRAEMLTALIDGNLADRPFGFSNTQDSVIFRDIDLGKSFALLGQVASVTASSYFAQALSGQLQQFLSEVSFGRSVVFGSESESDGDFLLGLTGNDRLFGGAGEDSLDGDAGNDFLDGGAGDDDLFGGGGDDKLEGGGGTDFLVGGEGFDEYLFGQELDDDVIVDRVGAIFSDGNQLFGGRGEDGDFASADGLFAYRFEGDLQSEGTLLINGSLRVEGFRNGDLGIRLIEGPDEDVDGAAPFMEVLLQGDSIYVLGRDAYGNPLPQNRVGDEAGLEDTYDDFQGTPGNSHFVTLAGNDTIQDLLGGDDRIELGDGNDAGWGGTGGDIVEGGRGRDMVAGGRGDDILYAGTSEGVDRDLDPNAVAVEPLGGDLLSGGDGDDRIYGDAEHNVIEGGAGEDAIFAGAGNDWIGSDASALSSRERYRIFPPNNDWINREVDVLWPYGSGNFQYTLTARPDSYSPAATMIAGTGSASISIVDEIGDEDRIDAGAGDDTVLAGAGNDLVFGGSGHDYLEAGVGLDTLFGDDGDDYLTAQGDVVGDYLDGGKGDDQLYGGGGGTNVLLGGEGNDTVVGLGDEDFIHGGQGNDVLTSFGAHSVLRGGDGNDTLTIGVEGSALLDGGADNDTLIVSAGSHRIAWGQGQGADVLLWGGSALVVQVSDALPFDIDVASIVFPSEGFDIPAYELKLRGTDDALVVALVFDSDSAANLRFEFADGAAWSRTDIEALIWAEQQPEPHEWVAGTVAAEVLYGTEAGDHIRGGAGDDWLAGGEGNDTYHFSPGDGFDRIAEDDPTAGNEDILKFSAGIEQEDVDVFARGEDYILSISEGGVHLLDGATGKGAVERIEFADGSFWTPVDLAARASLLPENRAPDMPQELGALVVDPGQQLSFTIAPTAIADPDRFDRLSYHAVTSEGEPLPNWLSFDAENLTISGMAPEAGGATQLLVLAVDQSGGVAVGAVDVIVRGGAEEPPIEPGRQILPPADGMLHSVVQSFTGAVASELPTNEEVAEDIPPPIPAPAPTVGVPNDPVYREIDRRLDVLLQVGRTNLSERYAEAIREFEERRRQREEPSQLPQPTEEEVGAWNRAMHAWHERHQGFDEGDIGGHGGTWALGWGNPVAVESASGGIVGASNVPGLANPHALPRLTGAGEVTVLREGMRAL